AMSAGRLVEVTAEDCAGMFGQSVEKGPAMELMGLFARAMSDLGRLLLSKYDGGFEGLIGAAEGSAERLVGLLSEMPFFRDVERYEGLEVPFYKRAQLTAADLSLALEGRGLGAFMDLGRLTVV